MCKHCRKPDAEPLSAEAIQEFRDEDCAELLVELDGQTYNSEDLYRCDGCQEWHVSAHDLDDDGLCEECAEGAREYAAYVEDVRWTYYASVL